MNQFVTVNSFLGAVTSVAPTVLDPRYAQDLRNVMVEDGLIRPRYGYNVASLPVSGMTNVRHFQYYATALVGAASSLVRPASGSAEFGTSRTRQEFYISVEDRIEGTRPYFIDPSNMTRYEITDRGSHLSLSPNGGYWRGFAFNDSVFLFNQDDPNYPLATLTLGATGSFTAVQVPETPSNSLSQRISVIYSKAASGYDYHRYRELTWAGLDASSEIAYTGCATAANSAATTNLLSIAHVASASGEASFEVDMNAMSAGVQDWTYNDAFYFTLNSRTPGTFELNPYSIKVTLSNNDASVVSNDLATIAGVTTYGYAVYAFFPSKVRSLWDNTRKLKVSYTVSKSSSTATDNRIDMSVVTIGGVKDWPSFVKLGYSWINSTYGYESGVGGVGTLDQTFLKGSEVSLGDRGTFFLGTIPRVTVTAGGSLTPTPDYTALYIREGLKWRKLGQNPVSALVYLLTTTNSELQDLDEYTPSEFSHRNVTCAVVYRNAWVIWGYDDGSNNIRHSRIGEPTKLATDSDTLDDTNRGQDFTLGDISGDVPRAMVTVDNVLFIFGDSGVYAQIMGDNPSLCTPPKKIAGAPPMFGPEAFTKWKDDQGRPGVAYVDSRGEGVYFLTVSNALDFDVGQRPIELSTMIRRNVMQSFLFGASPTPNPETLHLFIDERNDSLWLYFNSRALVYRRRSLVDGNRHWELYEYQDNGYNDQRHKFSFHPYWGIRAMRLDGTIDEYEYKWSTRSYISGANRDGGEVMSPIYWKSKDFTFDFTRTRLFSILVNKEGLYDQPVFTVTSTENSSTYTDVTSGWHTRFSPLQKGLQHSVKITLTESASAVRAMTLEFHKIGKLRQS